MFSISDISIAFYSTNKLYTCPLKDTSQKVDIAIIDFIDFFSVNKQITITNILI